VEVLLGMKIFICARFVQQRIKRFMWRAAAT